MDNLSKDPGSCKIIATMSNGTIKTLCDTKENGSINESLSEIIGKKLENDPTTYSSPTMRLVPNVYHYQNGIQLVQDSLQENQDCKCNGFSYLDQVSNVFQQQIVSLQF